MDTHFRLSENDSVTVYSATIDGRKCFKLAIQVGAQMANGMHETFVHHREFACAAEANRLAFLLQSIGQVDLANYTWTPANAFVPVNAPVIHATAR